MGHSRSVEIAYLLGRIPIFFMLLIASIPRGLTATFSCSGQERFGALTVQYYRKAHGAFIVFDITDERTFVKVAKWVRWDIFKNISPVCSACILNVLNLFMRLDGLCFLSFFVTFSSKKKKL